LLYPVVSMILLLQFGIEVCPRPFGRKRMYKV